MKNWTSLHNHNVYSFLDGAANIKDMVKRAKELGMTHLATTNHNHIGDWIEFKEECESEGITPILGVEMYQTWDTDILSLDADRRKEIAMEKAIEDGVVIPEKVNGKKVTKKYISELISDYTYDTKQYHVLILAINQTGVNNLIKLQSEAANKCTYNARFCCDFKMLEKYNEGLVVTSACLGGIINNLLIKGKADVAYKQAVKFKDIFGDRFYLEIQPLFVPEQTYANEMAIELSKELNIELVATNDVHYTLKEDYDDHDSLLCVGIGKKKNDPDRMRYEHEFWLRSYDEMIEGFLRHEDIDMSYVKMALENTNKIARMTEKITLGSSKPLFPKVHVPIGHTPETYLTARSYSNLYKYLKKHPDYNRALYELRLATELSVINPKGFAPYMLSIFENVDYCKEKDIPIGTGRGSAAGSLCLFVNGGTKIDPIQYDLLFFRFLTADRIDPPDYKIA